ncbi:MAG: Lrp/AsnC family transcriptional regulator [Candidatus Methanoplasma sp.]|jgi:DNA-binding Lrp family transcriptional regulator|nr:Lrp/AsnC family transcriptional regulator [Candidatus Methanoplasma sp.]
MRFTVPGVYLMADINDYDDLDRRIVELLCKSSQGSFRQIAKQLTVHPTTLIQRVKALEAKGVVNGYRAKVNYLNLGFEYMGMVHVYADDVVDTQEKIKEIPQVMAIFDVTGDADIIVMISCLDREEFSDTVKRINSISSVRKTNTSVVLNVVKDIGDFVPVLRNRE